MGYKKADKCGKWSIQGYTCNNCNDDFGVFYFGTVHNCPYCGSKNIDRGSEARFDLQEDLYFEEQRKTASEIANKIKEEFHGNCEVEKLENLLDELTKMAEKGEE